VDFLVVDVETANPDSRSICQIGIVGFRDGVLVETWQSLVNPGTRFDPGNIAIHGIRPEDVRDAPNFADIFHELRARFDGRIVGSHTAFDRRAICGAAELHGLPAPTCRWLDTAQVVRRAWPQFAKRGYGLANLSRHFGLPFRHHDALEDARLAGEVLLRAIRETGISAEEWLLRVNQPPARTMELAANPDGPLFGEVVVFDKGLHHGRTELALRAAAAGCRVIPALRTTATMLVVADTARTLPNGRQRRAEELIRLGYPLRILTETEFLRLLRATEPSGAA